MIFFKRKCLFCNGKGKLSKEHIIPKWLLEELNLSRKEMVGTHFSVLGMIKSKRTHNFSQLVNGLICKDCNSGWMSRLEVAAQPIITSLMNLKGNLHDIVINNSEFIAKWAFKTAIVLNYGTNYRKLVPLEHFRLLYNDLLPEGIYVNLGIANEVEDIYWQQTQTLVVKGDKEKVANCIAKRIHYKISFQFRHLLLKVCYFPYKEFTIDPDFETSIFLWPKLGIAKEIKPYKNFQDFATRSGFVQS